MREDGDELPSPSSLDAIIAGPGNTDAEAFFFVRLTEGAERGVSAEPKRRRR
jgi:hypothetical protein